MLIHSSLFIFQENKKGDFNKRENNFFGLYSDLQGTTYATEIRDSEYL